MIVTCSVFSEALSSTVCRSFRSNCNGAPCVLLSNLVTTYNAITIRKMSKSAKLLSRSQRRDTVSIHKNYFPDSFVYKRGDHPYGSREYLLVRPKRSDNDAVANYNSNDDAIDDESAVRTQQQLNTAIRSPQKSLKTSTSSTPTAEPLPPDLLVLATLHANNNVVFGANVNVKNAARQPPVDNDAVTLPLPSILDLCPILLHSALNDCSNQGEQPQALSTLHGLSEWVRQCLREDSTIHSVVIRTLQEQIGNPTTPGNTDSLLKSTSVFGGRIVNANARQQLECITAIATNVPRSGHSVVGQKTHADGAYGWEAVAREYALLDYDITINGNDTAIMRRDHDAVLTLSEECLLYRQYSESCELAEIKLLADTSPAYLLSAGGAMARFFMM